MKDKIVTWLRKKYKESKAQGIVVGLSGGIDSAVVAALAKHAVGKKGMQGHAPLCLAKAGFSGCAYHGALFRNTQQNH